MKKHLGWFFWVILLLLITLLPLIKNSYTQEINNGNISFMPNVISQLILTSRTGRNNESFRFEWLNNTFDLELLFNATYNNETRLFSLKDFEDDFNVTIDYQINQNENNVQFGWIIENVENVNDYIYNAWFKIEDSSFDYEEIKIEKNLDTLIDFGYNITYYHLPDNLRLSFADLNDKGFIIGNQNKTTTNIKGFNNKTEWNLDPIVESGGIITITGYSTEGTSADHDDIFTSLSNTTISNKQDIKQYSFGYARIVIGDGENTTWFVAEDQQVSFNTSCFTANSQYVYEVKTNSSLRFGVLVSESDKTTRNGLAINVHAGSYNYIQTIRAIDSNSSGQIYSSLFDTDNIGTKERRITGYNITIYNTILNSHNLHAIDISGEIYNVLSYRPRYGVWDVQTSIERLIIFNAWGIGGGLGAYLDNVVNAKNCILRNNNNFFYASSLRADNYIINADIDSWTISWNGANLGGKIYRRYEFDLNVTNSANIPIQNANITISHYGEAIGQDFTVLTGSNGSFQTQTLTMGFYNQTGANTIYNYNDFNIIITHTSYATKTFNFTLGEKINWQIVLETSITDYSIIFLAIGLCIGLSLVVIGVKIKK